MNLTGNTKSVTLESLMLTVIFTRGGYILHSCFRFMIENSLSQKAMSEAFICKISQCHNMHSVINDII